MPITVERTLYQFDELEDSAKETARDWWRSCRDGSDFDFVRDDFVTIAELLGITIDMHNVPLMGGGTRQEPSLSWSVGYCQSDYAAFDGRYTYRKGSVTAIKKYAPKDEELHHIASQLYKIQKENFYHLSARIKYHSYYGQQVDVENDKRQVTDATDSAITDAMRLLARWLYKSLRTEDEYQSADEQVDESMRIMEYTFNESGKREEA